MGPIDFTPLIWLGVAIGLAIAAGTLALAFGAYWLYQHVVWVW